MAVEDEEEFFSAEGSVVVGEAESAVELWVVAEPLVDAGHANEDHREVFTVVAVAEQLERSRCEPFGFVDDEQIHEVRHADRRGGRFGLTRAEVFVGADLDLCLPAVDVVHEIFGSAEDLGCVEDSPGSVGEGVVLGVVLAARSPLVDVGLQSVPVCVAAGGVGLADAGVAVADADGFLFADGVREFGEASVLFGDDEWLVHRVARRG